MSSIDKLNEALAEWGMNVAKSVLPQVQIPVTSGIGRMMSGFLGIDLSSYNIYNELGFLLKPTLNTMIKPYLHKFLGGMSDEEVERIVMEYAAAFKQQASERGYVNLFGVQLGESAFVGLEDILTSKLR